MKTLIVMNGPDRDRLLPLHGATTSIGRSACNDHALRDPRISDFHALLTVDARGRVSRHDISVRENGLRAEGRRLSRVVPMGGVVELGGTVLELCEVPDDQVIKLVEESGERRNRPERAVYLRVGCA